MEQGENAVTTTIGSVATSVTGAGSWDILLIIAVMLICGGLGGFAAWLLAPSVKDDSDNIRYQWFGYVAVGAIASIAVPLFLSMAQSTLIADGAVFAQTNHAFIFAGFCVIAGFSARAFLSTIADKVLKDMQKKVEEAEQVADDSSGEVEELRRLIQDEATPVQPDRTATPDAVGAVVAKLDDTHRKVLQSTGSLTMRTASGIAKGANMPRDAASKIIEDLITKGLAERTTSPSSGNLRFKVTPMGVSVLNTLSDSSPAPPADSL